MKPKKEKTEFTKEISAAEIGKDWPFTVNKGTLINRDLAIIFKDETGKEYAINGQAIMRLDKKKKAKYLSMSAIWKKDPSCNQRFMSISRIIRLGLDLNPNNKY